MRPVCPNKLVCMAGALGVAFMLLTTTAMAQTLDLGGATSSVPAFNRGLDVVAVTAPLAVTPGDAPLEPILLDGPLVVDTAKLTSGNATVALFGIVGLPGEAAQGLQGFIAAAGAKVTCQQQAAQEFICLLPDGTDVAMVALVNGAARSRADAPDSYREQEAAAQAARRRIWASLPPPPVQVRHPTTRNTAALLADGKTYWLDGVEGLGGSYARDLQGYIQAHDDSLLCQPQDKADHYICVLPDGTDIAKVALVNGAAKVATDAPDSYRVQQGSAVANKRGIWANLTTVATQAVPAAPMPAYSVAAGDEADGIAYVGGVPAAMIGGETVFLTYAGVAGWGYYDRWRHWRGAPEGFRRHMESFHPGGAGLRSFRPAGPAFGGAHLAAGVGHVAPSRGGFVHPAAPGGGLRPANAGGGGSHPANSGGGGRHR
jgi:endonuclease YncB( thermonuclease family)